MRQGVALFSFAHESYGLAITSMRMPSAAYVHRHLISLTVVTDVQQAVRCEPRSHQAWSPSPFASQFQKAQFAYPE